MSHQSYQVEPQTMDVDGGGATATHAYQKKVRTLTKMHPITTVNAKGRASSAAEKSLGGALPNTRQMWMRSWSGAEQGHFLSQCKAVNLKQPWRRQKRSPNQGPKIRSKRRWLALPKPKLQKPAIKSKDRKPAASSAVAAQSNTDAMVKASRKTS